MTRCTFTHQGKPTTKPGTADDVQRIRLSQWITGILIAHGDEQPGDYLTPGLMHQPTARPTRHQPRADAAFHVVLHPPGPQPSLEPVLILAHGRVRQHWHEVCLLGFVPDYLFPARWLTPSESVWAWEENYLSYDSLRFLVTGVEHCNSHAGLTPGDAHPFQQAPSPC